MRVGITQDACMTADDRHRAAMELAGATMRRVLQGEMPTPRGLRWVNTRGGYVPRETYPDVSRRAAEKAYRVETQRTSRDACPRCGARGDAGCGHAPVKDGRLVAL
jgi:hypothetical protein